jgi:two-component system cell cycle sensor histidine kinase/response regulator CckA
MKSKPQNTSSPFAVVINDDPTQIKVLSGLLLKVGINPRAFTAAEAALAEMTANDGALPALIVTDLYMPGIDGWRFCRLLRSPEYAALNHIPILVVSGTFVGEEPDRIAADLGADAFLSSPVDGKRFGEQIRAILNKKQVQNPLRVLIVEDSRTISGMLKKAFAGHGYEADTALTFRAASDAFAKTAYDVAVLDYHLPDGTGDALLDAFRAARPDCVCIMMTIDPGPGLALDWMKRGAAAYLRKPFKPEYLIELCANARRERSLLRVQDLLELRTRELRESESQYRGVFAVTPDGVIVHDADGVILDANEAMAQRLEIPGKALLGRHIAEFITQENAANIGDNVQITLSGQSHVFETAYISASGKTIPAEVHERRIQWRNGQAVLSISRDMTRHKQAQEKLRESEEKYRTILENIEDGYYEVDLAGNFTFLNDSMCRILGYSSEEMIGMNNRHFTDKEHAKKLFKTFNEVYRTGQPTKEFDWQIVRKDGTKRYIEVSVSLHNNSSGKPIGFQGVSRDITERKQAEDALRQSEAKYRRIVETAIEGIVVLDCMARITFVNQQMASMLGYKIEELLGQKYESYFPEDELDDHYAQMSLREQGKGDIYERCFRRKDGGSLWTIISAKVIYDSEGRREGSFAMVSDITERKRAEKELINSEEKFRMLAESSAFAIMMHQGDNWIYANRAAEEISGYAEEELCSMHFWDIVHPDHRDMVKQSGHSRQQGQVMPRAYEFKIITKDGVEKWVSLTGNPIQYEDKPTALISVTDITERRQAEVEKDKLATQLEHSQKMESIGRLAGGVAHDFNNMLSVILGYSEMAINQVGPGHQLNRHLTQIRNAAQRSAELTQQLLAFARKQTVAPRVLDLNETIESMLKMLQRLIGEDIQLQWHPKADLWQINVDPSQIDQILANLCVNARDAIADVGKIVIETENSTIETDYCESHPGFLPGEYLRLAVSDDGCGMDKETLDKLFEPFFTTKETGKGTGLGLATVYGIVKQNNGFVNVYSEHGQGTTFTIYLPRHKGKGGQKRPEAPVMPTARGHETILLVEDEPAILEITTTMLEHQGYTVRAAGTPGDAIRLAREHTGEIDLLVTDVVMPEMNGRDLAKNILSLYPQIKRLFMSGYTANVIAHHGVLDEGVYFIQKPFSIKDLAAKVREALDGNENPL